MSAKKQKTAKNQAKSVSHDIQELEQLVQRIESEDASLDESIELLKEAMTRAKTIKAKLRSVELSVQELLDDYQSEEQS
jgi:exodeoxyribonuclease VII small subunit